MPGKETTEIFRKVLSFFLILLILSTDFTLFAYADGTETGTGDDGTGTADDGAGDGSLGAGSGTSDDGAGEGTADGGTGTSGDGTTDETGDAGDEESETGAQPQTRPSFTCDNTALKPEEVQKLWDSAINNGFNADEITSGATPPAEREKMDQNTVVIPTGEDKEAVKTEVPSEKIIPAEVPWLNQGINGPFAFGIVLADTLRVGKCEGLDENRNCPLQGKNLALRNSGEGIGKTAIWLKDDTVAAFRNLFTGDAEKPAAMSQEEFDGLQQRFAMEDMNEMQMDSYSRISGKLIQNHVLTDNFDASMETNCSNTECVIATYSMFDKYFNRWFAGEMVLSNAGPQAWSEAQKLLGWTKRRGLFPWSLNDLEFVKSFQRTFADPSNAYGAARVQRIKMRADRFGFSDFFNDLIENEGWTSGYLLTKSGSERKWWAEKIAAPGGFLDSIKEPERRRAFYDILHDLHGYARYNEATRDLARAKYLKASGKFGIGSAQETAARIEYAQTTSKMMRQYDIDFSLDFPEWLSRDETAGLYKYGVKNLSTGEVVPLSGDSMHLQAIMREFEDTGSFKGLSSMSARNQLSNNFYHEGENLILYEIKSEGVAREIPVADLEKHLSELKDKVAVTERGERFILNENTLQHVKSEVSGTVKVYDAGGWQAASSVNPEQFSGKLLHSRAQWNLVDGPKAATQKYMDTAIERNMIGRRYTSVLDKAMVDEVSVLRNYFLMKGAVKWTVYPYLYWAAKRYGFGLTDFAAYRLPETWQEIGFDTGEGEIYGDSFIDFFANEGSDTGDIFVQILNILPWKLILNEVVDKYLPFKDTYEKFTGDMLLRSKVDNLALYLSTNPNCATCFVNIKTQNLMTFEPNFAMQDSVDMYILEDTISKEAKEKGSNLISFAHHISLDGTSASKSGGDIDLAKAIKEQTTCREKAKEALWGWDLASVRGFEDSPYRIAAIAGFGESLGYVVFGWSGIFGSIAQQTLILPKLNGCVDVEEGYFTHIYAPKKEEAQAAQPDSQLSTENITTVIKEGVDKVMSGIQTDPNTFTGDLTEQFKEQVAMFTDEAKKEDIVEGIIKIPSRANGRMTGEKLFMFWWKGVSQPTSWPTEGERNFVDSDTDTTVTIDNKEGTISVNGEKVIENPYLVPLTTTNTEIPAAEIPQRATVVGLTNADTPLFEMNIDSDVYVLDNSVLSCIQKGVMEQTGVPLKSNNLSDAFGKALSVVTNAYGSISADKEKNRITASGETTEFVEGAGAKVVINANRRTTLKNSEEVPVGLMQSIQFANGLIIYKPDTDELVIWLRHHEQAVTHQNDISGLKANLTEVIDPITGCPVPAINLEAIPIAGSDRAAEKVQLLNDSLGVMGPFKKLETDKKIYIFYSKKTSPSCDVSDPTCCVPYFKVIDKETGEVLVDQPITSIKQTPTGLEITTADGNKHTLDFSAPNGVPMVSYNGGPPETIRTAQGPNGSFYYDPETGLWYPENAQLLPMDDAFKQHGVLTNVNPDGTVSSKPGDNIFNIGQGTAQQPLNLPSMPENLLFLIIFIASFLAAAIYVRARFGPERLGN